MNGMFHEESYKRHAKGFAADLVDPKRKQIAATWFDDSTADYWLHDRCYEIANYLGGNSGERWMTVGDGRFGLDAIRLRSRGIANVLPTDLDESLLRASKERCLISEYSVENAERLSFEDAAFDYVFCKQAYHHFPRPAIALYEMLRVAKKGVILIEPNDRRLAGSLLRRLFGFGAKHLDHASYEEDGNYVYSISKREIEKVALGINLPQVAFKGMNEYYYPGLEFEKLDSPAGKKMKRRIAVKDFLCRLGLDKQALLMACLFRVPLEAGQRNKLERNGWQVIDLPRNPYHPA